MTTENDPHESKISPNDPRLTIPRPTSRTLKKGPIMAVLGTAGALATLAIGFALREPPAKNKNPFEGTPIAAPQDRVLPPDTIRDAPDNRAPVGGPPVLQRPPPNPPPPLLPPGAGSAAALPSATAQRLYEDFQKARTAPLLFETGESENRDQQRDQNSNANAPQASSTTAPTQGRNAAAGSDSDPNMQERKNSFVTSEQKVTEVYVTEPVLQPRSPYELKAGTIIPAVLITGINSDLPGIVIGQVRENVYDTITGRYLLVPQGSRLIANYDSMIAYGQERVLVCWSRLIRPDGSSVTLACMPATDLAGYSGFADEVDNHWWRIIKGALFSSVLAAGAAAAAGDIQGYHPTVAQNIVSGAASDVATTGKSITQKSLSIQPTITIRPGFSVNVVVSKDIILPPYQGR